MRWPLISITVLIGAVLAAQTADPVRLVPVIFETALGRITVEVDAVHAPVTAANFLRYVDGRFYDGGMVDRAVRPDNTTRHDVEIQVNADGQGFAAFGRVVDGMEVVKKIQAAPTQPAGAQGPFGTETLSPPIAITRASRK